MKLVEVEISSTGDRWTSHCTEPRFCRNQAPCIMVTGWPYMGFMQHIWVQSPVKGNEVCISYQSGKATPWHFSLTSADCQTFCYSKTIPDCLMSQKIHLHWKWPTCASALACIVLNSMWLFRLLPPPFHAWLIGNSYIGCNCRKSYSHPMWLYRAGIDVDSQGW